MILGLALFSYAEQRANAIAMFAGGYAAFSPDYQNLLREISIGQMLIVIGIVIMIPGIILKKKDSEHDDNLGYGIEEPKYVKESEWNPKKSPTVKGIFIGIIMVSIIFGGIFVSMYHSFVVSSGGMAPELQIFDLIRYNEVPFKEIKINDIIVYYSPSEQDTVIVHRVAAILNEDPFTIRTKGDANPASIPGTDFPITEKEYIGKIVTIIHGGGHITKVFAPPFNIIILVAAFVIPIVIMKKRGKKN